MVSWSQGNEGSIWRILAASFRVQYTDVKRVLGRYLGTPIGRIGHFTAVRRR